MTYKDKAKLPLPIRRDKRNSALIDLAVLKKRFIIKKNEPLPGSYLY